VMISMSGIATEVVLVEDEDATQAVDLHRGYQARVMHLHAGDAVSNHQSLPFSVDLWRFAQQSEKRLSRTSFSRACSCENPSPLF